MYVRKFHMKVQQFKGAMWFGIILSCCYTTNKLSLAPFLRSHVRTHSQHTHPACFKMHGGLFIIGGVLQLTNKYLEMKSSGQDMFTQTLLKDFMADVSL